MKKIMILMSVMLFAFLFAGCGNKNVDDTESAIGEAETNVLETAEMTSEKQVEAEAVNREDYEYIDEEDIFVVKEIDTGDGTEVDDSTMELFSINYVIPESIDIYSYFGTYAGYTKPGIEISSGSRNDEWTRICFATSSFLVKTEDFDRVAQIVEDEKDTENQVYESDIEEWTFTPGTPQDNVEIATPKQETSSDKCTAEEAIAVYRSILESNGITWDPSLKEFASWGTGFLPIDKNEVENVANSTVKAYAMGDTVGHSWTKYYLEVTGSDENYVYYTEYHSY